MNADKLIYPPLPTKRVTTLFAIITEACNSRCHACSYWRTPEPQELNVNVFQQTILALMPMGLSHVMFTGGEPLLHAGLPQMARIVKSIDKSINVKVATNGILVSQRSSLMEENVDLWVVSIDAVTQDVYEAVRGLSCLPEVLASIEALVRRGQNVRCSFLIQRRNYHQFADFVELCLRLGVHSASILVPHALGNFGPSGSQLNYRDEVILRTDQVEDFKESILPRVYKAIQKHPNFLNVGQHELAIYVDYLTAMSTFENEPKRFRNHRCPLPINSLVLQPRNEVKPCFLMPHRFPLSLENPANSPEMCRFRSEYYFGTEHFEKYCTLCMQVYPSRP